MEPFIGEIKMFGGTFAPRSWAFCDGQLLPINGNDALFSILGTTYGGDGRTTFGLPDLRGRVAMHEGNGPGLSHYRLGQKGGEENVALAVNHIPAHQHHLTGTIETKVKVSSNKGTTAAAKGNALAKTAKDNDTNAKIEMYDDSPDFSKGLELSGVETNLSGLATVHSGGGQSHNNMPPYICINYIIALHGVYPSRS